MMQATPNESMPDMIEESALPIQAPLAGRSGRAQVVINAASNAGVMVIKALLAFVVSPILVHGLGDKRYGVWMFISSITAYLALGDFGVKSAIVRFVGRYDGLNDREGINRVVNTSSTILTCAAAIILAVIFSAAYFGRLPASVGPAMAQEARWFFVLSGITVAFLLKVSVPQAMLAGLGRFPLRNGLSIVSMLLRNVALVAVAWHGGTLFAVGVVLLANVLIDYGLLSWAARHSFPQLACSYRYVDRAMLRTVCGYGTHVFASDIAHLVIGQSAPLIIGMCLVSAESVTYFSLGSSLNDYATSILAMVVFVLIPAVSKWQAAGEHGEVRSLYIHATRYAMYFIAPIQLGLLVFGYPFLTLWMGRRYADASYMPLVIISMPLVLSAGGMVAARVLLGLGRVRPLAIITLVQAALTVALSMTLAHPFGLEGVALGVALAVAFTAPAMTILTCRCVKVGFFALLWETLWRPLSATALAGMVWIAARQWLPIDNWFAFFGVGILGMAAYSLVVVGLERDLRTMGGAAAGKCAGLVSTLWRSLVLWRGIPKD